MPRTIGFSAPCSYTVYGYLAGCKVGVLGFTGQWLDAGTRSYPLGSGHRVYSPALMRFISADVLSPFGEGGVNTYAYCAGDPINYLDLTGQWRTGLTAQMKRNNIPGSFKLGIKAAFKDSQRNSFRFEFGKAYEVTRDGKGRFTIVSAKTFNQLNNEFMQAQEKIRLLENQAQLREIGLAEQTPPPALPPRPGDLAAPLQPSPGPVPPLPPKGIRLETQASNIRNP